jgi:hypothetical protein
LKSQKSTTLAPSNAQPTLQQVSSSEYNSGGPNTRVPQSRKSEMNVRPNNSSPGVVDQSQRAEIQSQGANGESPKVNKRPASHHENADFASLGDPVTLQMLDDKHDDLAIDNQIEEGHHFKGANKEFYEDLLRHQKILNELINNRP